MLESFRADFTGSDLSRSVVSLSLNALFTEDKSDPKYRTKYTYRA